MEEPKIEPKFKLVKELPKAEPTITIKQSYLWQGICAVLIVVLALSIWTGGFGLNLGGKLTGNAVAQQPTPDQQQPSDQEIPRVQVSTDDDPFIGSADAPVTIISFSDFQCPYCSRAADILTSLEEKYVKTGQVKIVFRDFPLNFHPNAEPAAEAAACANEQGKYAEMDKKIFAGQSTWSAQTNPKDIFKGYATELGLDVKSWEACYDAGKYKEEIAKDFADGQSAGVSGTPTFFIGNEKNGYIKVVGAQPAEVFDQVIALA